jgi:hypothetical protein
MSTAVEGETDRELVHLLRVMNKSKPADVVERLRVAVSKAMPATLKSPLAEALFRGIEARQRIREMDGGTLSAEDTGRLLGIVKQAVIDRYNKGRLLGWREKQGAIRFPVWQFGQDGNVLAGLAEALAALSRNEHLDDWAKVLFFVNPRVSLKNQRPLDLLRKGETRYVIELARAEAE